MSVSVVLFAFESTANFADNGYHFSSQEVQQRQKTDEGDPFGSLY